MGIDLKTLLADHQEYDLYVFDINGVIDNLFATKMKLFREIFGIIDNVDMAHLITGLDRFYEKDKDNSLDNLLKQVLNYHNIPYSESHVEEFCSRYFGENTINEDIISYLNQLMGSKEVCLYTSLSRRYIHHLFKENLDFINKIKIYSKEDLAEEKPSVNNLIQICLDFNVIFEKTILLGDNIVVDLMPAKLLGMTTMLISPYVDLFYQSKIS